MTQDLDSGSKSVTDLCLKLCFSKFLVRFHRGFICNAGICEGILDVVMLSNVVVEEGQLGDLLPRKIFIVSTSLAKNKFYIAYRPWSPASAAHSASFGYQQGKRLDRLHNIRKTGFFLVMPGPG